MKPKVSVVISVDEQHVDRLNQVAQACRQAGLSDERLLDALGVITGTIDPDHVAGLRGVQGVAAVEKSAGYQVRSPPPTQ